MYVGQTSLSIGARWKQHVVNSNRCSYIVEDALCRAIRKYGAENFSIRILEYGLNAEQAIVQEMFHIARLGTFGDGYNMSPGGEGNSARIAELRAQGKRVGGISSEKSKEVWARRSVVERKTILTNAHKTPRNFSPEARKICSEASKSSWSLERREQRKNCGQHSSNLFP
jgi:group I intron endonuclease